jgi:hypothetical protein
VLARAYLELASARVGSCFSWSTCPTCSDPKNSVRRLRGSSPRLSRAARSGDRDRDARRQDRHPAGGPPRAASAVRGGQGTCQPGAEHRVSVLRHLGYEVIPPPEPRQGHHRRSGRTRTALLHRVRSRFGPRHPGRLAGVQAPRPISAHTGRSCRGRRSATHRQWRSVIQILIRLF